MTRRIKYSRLVEALGKRGHSVAAAQWAIYELSQEGKLKVWRGEKEGPNGVEYDDDINNAIVEPGFGLWADWPIFDMTPAPAV